MVHTTNRLFLRINYNKYKLWPLYRLSYKNISLCYVSNFTTTSSYRNTIFFSITIQRFPLSNLVVCRSWYTNVKIILLCIIFISTDLSIYPSTDRSIYKSMSLDGSIYRCPIYKKLSFFYKFDRQRYIILTLLKKRRNIKRHIKVKRQKGQHCFPFYC